jgi:hypothetical protein
MSGGPIFIGGHSLGAARAWEYVYSRLVRGLRVDGVYPLAPPNPGNKTIATVINMHQANLIIQSVKNGRDLVPDVPVDLPLVGEEYVQPWPFTEINQPPPSNDSWGVFAWHHIELYQAGANALPKTGAAIELSDAADQIAALYQTQTGWDWINPVDGFYTALKIFPNGAKLLIFRGSTTGKDWLDDFDATQIDVMNARMSRGFWAGISPIQDQLDAQLV